jgi:hypothetical protein
MVSANKLERRQVGVMRNLNLFLMHGTFAGICGGLLERQGSGNSFGRLYEKDVRD